MKKYISIILCLVVLCLVACKKDFIVENIDKKSVIINAPANDFTTSRNMITFWWEPLEGAEQYKLQIVTPDFQKVAQLVIDTNVSSNKFTVSLDPGSYQWRIKGTNAGHSTVFQTYNLTVDTTSDLRTQLVNLLSPGNGTTMGNSLVKFTWKALKSAKQYRLQINGGTIKDTLVTGTSFSYSLPAAKNSTTAFTWNAKATNDQGETEFNAVPFNFTIDLKGPGTPVQLLPVHGNNVLNTDTLKWSHSFDAVLDSLYIADDSTFTNSSQFATATARYSISELNISANIPGTYYWWKLRSFDLYGNSSSYSIRKKFRVLP